MENTAYNTTQHYKIQHMARESNFIPFFLVWPKKLKLLINVLVLHCAFDNFWGHDPRKYIQCNQQTLFFEHLLLIFLHGLQMYAKDNCDDRFAHQPQRQSADQLYKILRSDIEFMLWDIWYLLRYLMKLAWKWAQVRARRRKLSWIVSTLFIFITFQHRPHHLCRQYQSGPSPFQSLNRFPASKTELSFQSEELNLRRNPLRTW